MKTKVAACMCASAGMIAMAKSKANRCTMREGHETDLHGLPCPEKCRRFCHAAYQDSEKFSPKLRTRKKFHAGKISMERNVIIPDSAGSNYCRYIQELFLVRF